MALTGGSRDICVDAKHQMLPLFFSVVFPALRLFLTCFESHGRPFPPGFACAPKKPVMGGQAGKGNGEPASQQIDRPGAL